MRPWVKIMTEQPTLDAFLVRGEKREAREDQSEERVEERGPYKLPEGWRWVRLGDICKINPSKREINDLSDYMKATFVPMAAVSEVTGRIEYPEVRPLGEVRKGYTYFKEGDVLFAKITPCMENGKSAIARNLVNGLGFGSTEFHILRPLGDIIPELVHYYVRQKPFREEAAKNMTGTVGHQRVPKRFLENVKIPLPPLEEQKHIVVRIEELVSRAEEARRLRRIAAEEAEKIMQAALHKVFRRVKKEGWEWVRLGDIFYIRKGTINPQEFPEEEFEYYSIPAYHETGQPEISKGKKIKSHKVMVRPNDCLFGRLNPHIPKVWMVEAFKERRQIASTELFPLVSKEKDERRKSILPMCLFWYLKTPQFLSIVTQRVMGTTGSRKRLPKNAFLNELFPLLSLEEQRRIAAYLNRIRETVESLKKLQQRTDEELEKLVPAILDRAFRGEL